MQLVLQGHDFRYEAEHIVLLFFPVHKDVILESTMTREGEKITVTSTVKFGNRSETCTDSGEGEPKLYVKRSAFLAARRISPLPAPWGILTGIRPAALFRKMTRAGKSAGEVSRIFREEYLVDEKKTDLARRIAALEDEYLTFGKKDISLYIGIPYCPTRCLYCSFVSSAAPKDEGRIEAYVNTLVEELRYTSEIIGRIGFTIRSIYIGGGTPTALPAGALNRLLYSVDHFFDLKNIQEYTVEAGRPDTITEEKLEIIRRYADRISINPQTIHDETLRLIGRNHTAEDFFRAFSAARKAGFKNINSDLIAGLPGENEEMFKKTLDTVLNLSPEGLTVHALYIKRASALRSMDIELPNYKTAQNMLDMAEKKTAAAGLVPYYLYRQKSTLGNLENAGYSKPGHLCLYNMATMADSMTVIALGAGSVTKLVLDGRIERIFNYKNPDEYIRGFDEIIKRKGSILNFY